MIMHVQHNTLHDDAEREYLFHAVFASFQSSVTTLENVHLGHGGAAHACRSTAS